MVVVTISGCTRRREPEGGGSAHCTGGWQWLWHCSGPPGPAWAGSARCVLHRGGVATATHLRAERLRLACKGGMSPRLLQAWPETSAGPVAHGARRGAGRGEQISAGRTARVALGAGGSAPRGAPAFPSAGAARACRRAGASSRRIPALITRMRSTAVTPARARPGNPCLRAGDIG